MFNVFISKRVLRTLSSIWDIPFKNGPNKICGRQPLEN